MTYEELFDISWSELIEPAWKPVEDGEMELGTKVLLCQIDRGGTKRDLQLKAYSVQFQLYRWLETHYRLECWLISVAKSPDPWGGWGIFAEYYGVAPNAAWKGKWKVQHRGKRRAKATP